MGKTIKNLILIILIIAVIAGIGFLIVNAVRSISYNKNAQNPVVTLSIEGYGDVKIELYPDDAPNTVSQIVNLVQKGFYTGKVFYGTDGKAVNGGMKAPTSTSDTSLELPSDSSDTSGSLAEDSTKPSEDTLKASYYDSSIEADSDADYNISIDGEFVANGYDKNTVRFEKGTVGLYRQDYEGYGTDLSSKSYNSGTSLFFITTEEDSTLNGMYAAFGKVISGMDIIETLNSLPTQESDSSSSSTTSSSNSSIKYFDGNYPVIASASIETYGVTYKTPKYAEAFDYNSYVSNLLLQYYSSNN